MSLRITALQARELSTGVPTGEFDEAMTLIYDKIKLAASAQQRRVDYIFDTLTRDQKLNPDFVEQVITALRVDGYKYRHVDSQDPGHFADRPNDWIEW